MTFIFFFIQQNTRGVIFLSWLNCFDSEKALAATGNGCAKMAMNWLVSHVNDPRLDEIMLREYTLLAVPVGAFGEQLLNFWHDSRDLCSWNDALKSIPHMTLVSFFKVRFFFSIFIIILVTIAFTFCSWFIKLQASADMEPHITNSVKAVVNSLNAYVEKRIDLRLHQDEEFIGFYINPPDKKFFENIATTFVDAVKSIERKDSKDSKCNRLVFFCCCIFYVKFSISSFTSFLFFFQHPRH